MTPQLYMMRRPIIHYVYCSHVFLDVLLFVIQTASQTLRSFILFYIYLDFTFVKNPSLHSYNIHRISWNLFTFSIFQYSIYKNLFKLTDS